ncbi:hypothetical protein AUF78_10950 [archaeon 13_1_20CM_2_51_12]|nr:MAG: hypothetical protein AUF78_10950 [archaeon 13_1_20CM_2_51_12]
MAGLSSSRLDVRSTRLLDKLRLIPSESDDSRIGFYHGGAQIRAFHDFHNSRIMKKMQPRIEYWKYSAQGYALRNSIR